MSACEDYEMLVSAFLDDQLTRDETVDLLDHLAGCATCRRFYEEGRALDAAARRGMPAAPAHLWETIASRSTAPAGAVRRFPGWAWKTAAGLLLAFGLWQLAGLRVATPLAEARPIEVTLGEDSTMTDAHFVQITAEILRADRRYHQAMLQVMRQVCAETGIEEGTEEPVLERGGEGTRPPNEVRDVTRLPG